MNAATPRTEPPPSTQLRIAVFRGVLHFALACLFAGVDFTVNATPPSIISQPPSQAVILYQQAAFGVMASGTAPLSYQWRKNGMPIAGATYDQIILAHAQFSDAGLYSVVVSNSENSVISSNANLTVNLPAGGDLDCSFTCGGSINGFVRSVAVQPDGKVLIAGDFSTVNGAARGGIARLNADGTTDHTFMNGLSGVSGLFNAVYSVALQNDGKVIIGGGFLTVNGVNRRCIARLNPDGSLDTGFLEGLSGSDRVFSIAVQSDGKILMGGEFALVNGTGRNRIARLNADGSVDNGFLNGLSGASSSVSSIAVQTDGKVLIGGGFGFVNGVSRNRIARLNVDGSLDTGFASGLSAAEPGVSTVAVQNDGKVLIGGGFSTVNGISRKGIARLNANGSLDSGFLNGLSGASPTRSIVVQSDGKVLIGGLFWEVNGTNRSAIARLNADGSLDSGFISEFPGPGSLVFSVALQSNGKVLIGGAMGSVFGTNSAKIARLNADGARDNLFLNPLSGSDIKVNSVVVQSDGKVVIGGAFYAVNGVVCLNIARLNADGTLDDGFLGGLSLSYGLEYVLSLAVQGDGKVLVGGRFSTINGVSRNNIARLNANGTLDSGFQNGLPGTSGTVSPYGAVYSVAVQSDGKVLIGGGFSTVNGTNRINIARLNADGTLDSGFQGPSDIDGVIDSVAIQNDGKVLIGGEFTRAGGSGYRGIARLNANGTLDTSLATGLSGGGRTVASIAVQSDGKILLGGSFGLVNGVNRTNIARLNMNGTLDTGFQNGLSGSAGGVQSVALQSDGKVLIGGYLGLVNGVSRIGIARLNADGTLDTGFQNGLSGTYSSVTSGSVQSVALQSDGKVLIGGDFTVVNGAPAAYLARLWGNRPPYIENITRPNGGSATLTLRLALGSTNRVQYKTNLTDGAWVDLAGDVIVSGLNSLTNKEDATLGTAQRRFYRVRQLP